MRISDWSSDVCSSDLVDAGHGDALPETRTLALDQGRHRADRRPQAMRIEQSLIDGLDRLPRYGGLAGELAAIGPQQRGGFDPARPGDMAGQIDRKSTRLNSSH